MKSGSSDILNPEDNLEIKQEVITVERKPTKFLRVPGIVGQFGQMMILDDNITEHPVSEKDAKKVMDYFKVDGIEFLDKRPVPKAANAR